jgi:hypothetical protein
LGCVHCKLRAVQGNRARLHHPCPHHSIRIPLSAYQQYAIDSAFCHADADADQHSLCHADADADQHSHTGTHTDDQLSQQDATLVNGDFQLNIMRAYTGSPIGNSRPEANFRYIILWTTIWNYSESEYAVFNDDFEIEIDEVGYPPDPNLMGRHKDQLQGQDPNRSWDYPDRNILLRPRLNVPAQGYKNMLLVYELPVDSHFLTLHMKIGEGVEKSVSLALFEQDDNPEEFTVVVEAIGDDSAWRPGQRLGGARGSLYNSAQRGTGRELQWWFRAHHHSAD